MKKKQQMKTFIARQGDVLLQRVEDIPVEAQPKGKPGNPILAYGETTGHHHQVQSAKAILLETPDKTVFLDLAEASELTHQEHAAITLPAGRYRLVNQREYSPLAIYRVTD